MSLPSRSWIRSRAALSVVAGCLLLSGCQGSDSGTIAEGSATPNEEVSAPSELSTSSTDVGIEPAAGADGGDAAVGACDDLPDKAAIELVLGVAVSDPVVLPVGCEFRGVANTSDVANFTRQTVQAKNATLKYAADTGSSPPTPLNDAALPGAVVALSYSVLFDRDDTSYLTQVVVGDGPAGSGTPKAVELMKLWVGA